MKTKKTLLKRIRITKNGKVIGKQMSNAHLKVKRSAARKNRKKADMIVLNKGISKKLKTMLGK